ncbi:MAG: cytochrome c maturation protein CcmE [Novosphingobium meiothermophilum]|uniref:cytochrome c maturation protein CcmE n=1 Tax=Novosphingobium TaxID=165696 RepID=UPI000D6E3AF0|nr:MULTISPECIES: cytochrome c maturation protein CcmE [Novosphingobium]
MNSTTSTGGIKPKHQRLVLLVIALVALIGAGLLAAYALSNQASYFYVPADLVKVPPEQGRAIRLGGMVEKGSLKTRPDGITIDFVVGDGKARVPVRYTGITPDLFVEGSGVVAEGRMEGNVFVADNLLAKHDENYVPRQMGDMSAEQIKQVVAETK